MYGEILNPKMMVSVDEDFRGDGGHRGEGLFSTFIKEAPERFPVSSAMREYKRICNHNPEGVESRLRTPFLSIVGWSQAKI